MSNAAPTTTALPIVPPVSPSSMSFPPPLSPKKDDLKPNAHPYPIKTTSTALLSRSNSSPQHHSHHSTSYYYVPSPSPTASPTRPHASPNLSKRGHGHQYSKSLSSDQPRPLPIPPSFPSPSPSPTNQFDTPSPRRLPSPPSSVPSLPPPEDLPSNPKTWTPSQLSTYLATALRIKSGEALNLPPPVARDIAAFVKQSKITGKSFLRFNESDLREYGINKLWSTTLLSASRDLRQNVLRGRIWGFGPAEIDVGSQSDVEEEDATPNRLRSKSTTNPFASVLYSSASSSSSVDLTSTQTPVKDASSARGRYRNGRVKGMVESFERSSSVDDNIMFAKRERRGSASSSDSYAPDVDENDGDGTVFAQATERPRPRVSRQSQPQAHDPLGSETESHGTGTGVTEFETASEAETEPTVEELLVSSSLSTSMPTSSSSGPRGREAESGIEMATKHVSVGTETHTQRGGVHAWEAGDGVGVTVKFIGESGAGTRSEEGGLGSSTVSGAGSWGMIGSVDGSADMDGGGTKASKEKGMKGRGRKDGRRLVSDIFSGAPNTDAQTEAGVTATDMQDQGHEMAVTRAMVRAFEIRLEEVERRVDDMEKRGKQREQAEAARTKELEDEAARQLQEEANRRTEKTVQTVNEAQGEQREKGFGMLSLSLLTLMDPRIVLGRVLGLAKSSASTDSLNSIDLKKRSRKARHLHTNSSLEPQSVSALPSYLLLVGISVCAVVLRVVLGRFFRGGLARRR